MPCTASRKPQAEADCLVTEPIANAESLAIGLPSRMAVWPKPLAKITSPSRITATDSPTHPFDLTACSTNASTCGGSNVFGRAGGWAIAVVPHSTSTAARMHRRNIDRTLRLRVISHYDNHLL